MQNTDWFFVIVGAIDALAGLASIFTGKIYLMGRSMSKYTEESLKKFSRPSGLMNLLCGLGLIAEALLRNEAFKIGDTSIPLGLVILVAALVLILIIYLTSKKILVKK